MEDRKIKNGEWGVGNGEWGNREVISHSPLPTPRSLFSCLPFSCQPFSCSIPTDQMKILNYVMAACFLFSAIVQYNDPDPLVWMLIYCLAGAACVIAIAGRLNFMFPAAIGIAALAWAMTLTPKVIGQVAFGELFEAFEMKDARVEVAREFGGLLIVAFWMSALVIQSLRRRKFDERVRK